MVIAIGALLIQYSNKTKINGTKQLLIKLLLYRMFLNSNHTLLSDSVSVNINIYKISEQSEWKVGKFG